MSWRDADGWCAAGVDEQRPAARVDDAPGGSSEALFTTGRVNDGATPNKLDVCRSSSFSSVCSISPPWGRNLGSGFGGWSLGNGS
jgi:hypothetical protein